MGLKSREKGKRGEREAAKFLGELLGIELRRGQQFSGSPDSPDIFGLKEYGLHPEVKRDEVTISKKTYNAIEQVVKDSSREQNEVPFVIARRNRQEWLIIIRAEDVIEFCNKITGIDS